MMARIYLGMGASLKIKLRNDTERWLGAGRFDFCVNIHVAALLENRKNLVFIYKYNNVTDNTFKYVVAGMIVSLLVIGYIVYRMSKVPRRISRLDIWALIFTLTAAYITTTVQLLATRAGIVTAAECRVISPFIYFFVLSIFFWLVAMSFHSSWMIGNFKKNSIKIHKEVASCANFKRFCIFCWLIPFIMTVYAIFVDMVQLATIWRPPLDSCLTEDVGTRVFMYIPIVILTAIRGILYVTNMYNTWKLQRTSDNIQDISILMISKHSYVVQIRLLIIIAVSGALQLIPNVPWTIYYTIHVYNIVVGTTMLAMFAYERYTHDVPITWYNFSEKFSEFCGKATGTTTGDRNSDITVIETALEERQQ